MELIELRAAARRHRVAGALAVLIVLLGGVWSLRRATPMYTADSTLLLTPRVELFTGASSGSIYRIIFPNVLALAKSGPLLRSAEQRYPEASAGGAAITAKFGDNSGVLTIGATASTAPVAVAWSRAVAAELNDRLAAEPYYSIGIMELAPGAAKGGKRLEILRAAGAVGLAALVFILTVFSLELLRGWADPTLGLRTRGISVLGMLPAPGRRWSKGADSRAAEEWSILGSKVAGQKGESRRIVVTSNEPAAVQQQAIEGLAFALGVLGTSAQIVDTKHVLEERRELPRDGATTLVDGPSLHAMTLLKRVIGTAGHCVVVLRMDPATFHDDLSSIRELMVVGADRVAVVVAPSKANRLLLGTLANSTPKPRRMHSRRPKHADVDADAEQDEETVDA